MALSAATIMLHRTLIRFAKGILRAWESWLNDVDPSVVKNPDPKQFFKGKISGK
jgi:hypothetical protein